MHGLIDSLNRRFSIKDLGAASVFLGIRIERDRPARKLWLSQKTLCDGPTRDSQHAAMHEIFGSPPFKA